MQKCEMVGAFERNLVVRVVVDHFWNGAECSTVFSQDELSVNTFADSQVDVHFSTSETMKLDMLE